MSRVACIVVVGLMVVTGAAWAGGGFDGELFDRWLEARVGSGEPVYWYSIGSVYTYPEGEVVATMEGFDTARLVRDPAKESTAHQLSRKIFVYRDPETNQVLTESNGMPVRQIMYPYQFITYELDGDRLVTWVEQGSGARLTKLGPSDEITARRLGDTAVFSAPLFLNLETPRGPYQAFEHYDFFIQPEKVGQPYQLSWIRYGDMPPFLGGGKAIIHLVAWRVDSFEELPATIRDWVKENAPLWLAPPKSIDEIRELQKPAEEPVAQD